MVKHVVAPAFRGRNDSKICCAVSHGHCWNPSGGLTYFVREIL